MAAAFGGYELFSYVSIEELAQFFNEYGRTIILIVQIVGLFLAGLFRRWKLGLSLCITLIATLVWGL